MILPMVNLFGMKNSNLNCFCCDMNDHMANQDTLEGN